MMKNVHIDTCHHDDHATIKKFGCYVIFYVMIRIIRSITVSVAAVISHGGTRMCTEWIFNDDQIATEWNEKNTVIFFYRAGCHLIISQTIFLFAIFSAFSFFLHFIFQVLPSNTPLCTHYLITQLINCTRMSSDRVRI